MRFRSRSHLAALTLLIAGAVVACTDKSPVFDGDPFFPDGRPVTLEAVIPAAEFLTLRGAFTGYTRASGVPYSVVANSFDGGVTSRTLVRFPGALPKELEFSYRGNTLRDSLYTVTAIELVLAVDSSASQRTPMGLSVHKLTERWDDSIASWTVRAQDSTGIHNWTTPGGSFNPAAVATAQYAPVDSAHTVVMAMDTANRRALADSLFPGLLIQATQANTLLQLEDVVLRVSVKPRADLNADSTFVFTYNSGPANLGMIYTPEPPQPAGVLQTGTVRSARSLFSIDLPDSLSVCTPGCVRWATKDLALHHVSLMLRPLPATGGYRLLDSATVGLRTVSEVELGRLAPLGEPVLAGFSTSGNALNAVASYAATDSLVEVPFTFHASRMLRGDTVPHDFAIMGARVDALGYTPFSLMLFDAAPRLRIVYTVPERPRLP